MIHAKASSSLDAMLALWSAMDLKAEFASEIARLTKIRDEINAKVGVVATVEQAAKTKAEADAYAAATRGAAGAAKLAAEALASDARAAMNAALKHEKDVQAREEASNRMQDEYARKDGELSRNMQTRESAVTLREQAATNREAKIAADTAALAERTRAFNERLAALKVPV